MVVTTAGHPMEYVSRKGAHQTGGGNTDNTPLHSYAHDDMYYLGMTNNQCLPVQTICQLSNIPNSR